MSQRIFTCVSSAKGSTTQLVASGRRTMSDSLMPFQPAIEEPSNILPSSKNSSSTRPAGIDTCCSLPFVSVKRKSTNFASLSLISSNAFSTDIVSSRFNVKMRNDQLHSNSGKSESDYHAIYMYTDFCGIDGHLSLPFELNCIILVQCCTNMAFCAHLYVNQPRLLCSV